MWWTKTDYLLLIWNQIESCCGILSWCFHRILFVSCSDCERQCFISSNFIAESVVQWNGLCFSMCCKSLCTVVGHPMISAEQDWCDTCLDSMQNMGFRGLLYLIVITSIGNCNIQGKYIYRWSFPKIGFILTQWSFWTTEFQLTIDVDPRKDDYHLQIAKYELHLRLIHFHFELTQDIL